jgi:PIN domain nuclease of toxin-antitoxin system
VTVHLDTHAAVWLRMGDHKRLKPVKRSLETRPLKLSPFTMLELQYLYEIGRLRENAREIMEHLEADYDLAVDAHGLAEAATRALDLSFSRDPFDRLIAGHALAVGATLLTADETLLRHVSCARWS